MNEYIVSKIYLKSSELKTGWFGTSNSRVDSVENEINQYAASGYKLHSMTVNPTQFGGELFQDCNYYAILVFERTC